MSELRPITEAFICVPDCLVCEGEGHVCENHPDKAWHMDEGGCYCGAGMPCPEIVKRHG